MSNYLAIAHVLASVKQQLSRRITAASVQLSTVEFAVGTPIDPADVGDETGEIRLCMYNLVPNAGLRNADLPTRAGASPGSVLQRPVAAYDIQFLISFYGSRTDYVPERLMGAALTLLHAYPVLNGDTLEAGVDDHASLAESDLGRQVDRIVLSPLAVDLEELARIWGMLTQTHGYVPSVAWQASVVLLEREIDRRRSLPVRTPVITTAVLGGPTLTGVENAESGSAVVYDSSLALSGRGLRGETTTVKLWNQRAAVVVESFTTLRATAIELSLSDLDYPAGVATGATAAETADNLAEYDAERLSPGVWSARVEHPIFRSAAIPIVIHPTIAWDLSSPVDPEITTAGSTSTLKLWVRPALAADQRPRIHLRRVDYASLAATTPKRFMVFDESSAAREVVSEWQQLTFDVTGVETTKTYVLQLEVDGVYSIPDTSGATPTPTVAAP